MSKKRAKKVKLTKKQKAEQKLIASLLVDTPRESAREWKARAARLNKKIPPRHEAPHPPVHSLVVSDRPCVYCVFLSFFSSSVLALMTKDLVTAMLEGTAIVSSLVNIRSLLKDKQVKGFNVWLTLYWLVYGMWFIFLYGAANLPSSASVVLIWMMVYAYQSFLSFYYRFQPRQDA